ncbi:MAG: hypothetical protein ACOY58_04040 [Candidatus Micrarchaeota archaeon]
MTKRKYKKPMTAAEHEAKLRKDPEWVRQQEEQEREMERRLAKLAEIEKPLVADLASAGWPVNSVWDLVNSSLSYPEAIPVLLRHLKIPYTFGVREGIARALTVKEARGIPAREILNLLKETGPDPDVDPIDEGFPWALANALSVVGDQSMVPEIEALLADERFQGIEIHAVLELALKKSMKRRKSIKKKSIKKKSIKRKDMAEDIKCKVSGK